MQRDIVLRWIDKISAIVARLLRGDRTVTEQIARESIEEAKAQLLGPFQTLAERLEAGSAADLLNEPFRIYGYAQLLALESAVERMAGRADVADSLAVRAVALGREAIRLSDPVPPDWVSWVEAAASEAGADQG